MKTTKKTKSLIDPALAPPANRLYLRTADLCRILGRNRRTIWDYWMLHGKIPPPCQNYRSRIGCSWERSKILPILEDILRSRKTGLAKKKHGPVPDFLLRMLEGNQEQED